MKVMGTVVCGYRVASGLADDSPYPEGSLRAQIPHFRRLGLDLSHCYPGTLNVNIEPLCFRIVRPRFVFADVNWIDGHPAETFSFSPCVVTHEGQAVSGYVYFPHTETKSKHFHSSSILEVVAPKITAVGYGSTVELELDSAEIEISRRTDRGQLSG